jgi:hypothetical protein
MGIMIRSRARVLLSMLLLCGVLLLTPTAGSAAEKVGVLFAVHGGFSQYSRQGLWDASMQMFSYEPNHTAYQRAIWCPEQWPLILDTEQALKEVPKYSFSYGRLGGTDPFSMLTDQQFADMTAEIGKYTCTDVSFEFDWVSWMSSDDISHYVYPRFMYNKPAAWPAKPAHCPVPSNEMNYCGAGDNGDPNPWPGCDPQRYNVDGPVERLLNKGVSQIILIDLTVGGMRFSKTYDIFKKIKLCLSDKMRNDVTVKWINDYNNLMQNSYPTDPATWTPQTSYVSKTGPAVDPSIPLSGNPNPVTTDPMLTTLNVEGIEAGMKPSFPASQTGILLLNHALVDWAEYFDPKIDDTVALNQSIEASLLARHPGLDAANIVGAYMGIKENGSAEGFNGVELTRNMRGENLGHAWLYETAKLLPSGKWGYKYWDALEYLKNRGVQHIVIGFPQIVTDSVLQLVEIPNQIGKEIGIKTWLKWGTFDYITYPGIGHPFADYWGIWVDTQCDVIGGTGKEPCCFQMGGCGGSQPYPPLRQTTGAARWATDPSLAYDLSDYGHLGYDPGVGAPNPNAPVQQQYTGTWAMYQPASADPRVGEMLAQHILNEFTCSINPTVINLADLKAIAGSWKVTVTWTTASEIDNAGFNIYRSTEENGTYTKINAKLIPATGSPSNSATYQFIDKPVKNRTTYWYKLEDVDVNGKATMNGPVTATPKLMAIFSRK